MEDLNYLILVRHGQSEWNLQKKFTGWVDVDLTPEGKLEACKAGEAIKNLNINVTSLENAELVLIGRKEENNFSEINEIIKNVSLGKNILSLNKDLTFPTEFGEKAGNGAVVKIIEDELSISIPTLGKSGDHYSSYFIQNKITVNYVIGDRVDTDIIFGKNLNAKTFLVSSGIKNYLDVDIADIQLNKFSDVVPFLTEQS